MKILIQSTAPFVHSSYGIQTALLAAKLIENKYEVIIVSNYGLQGGFLQYGINYKGKNYPITILPSGNKNYCQDVIDYYYKATNSDIILTLCDAFILENYGKRFPNRWIAYFPIDHQPVSTFIVDSIKGCWKPISYSEFAINELKAIGIKSTFLPLGLNTTIFKPSKSNFKKSLGFDKDCFLFGIIAANQDYEDRKQFGRQISAFSKFVKKYPNAKLYIHSFSYYYGSPSVPIVEYIKTLELEKHVRIPNKWEYNMGFSQKQMNFIYNGIDCLLNCSSGEGFGIPIIEAQATGTPVIGTDFSSMPELIIPGKTGELVNKTDIEFTSYGSYRKKPQVDAIVEKMEIVYNNLQINPNYYKRNCIKQGKKYDMDRIWDIYLEPFFEKIKKELKYVKKDLVKDNIKVVSYNIVNDLLEVEKI